MEKLALFGGKKVRSAPFPYPPYAMIGPLEKRLVMQALNERVLSTFMSSPIPEYFGGGFAKKLEKRFCRYYGATFAVSTDSGTAALHTALASAGIGFGDEVIVTPWSFSSSAKAPLFHNAIPVFADIEDRTYGLDPASIEKKISKYSKAIIVVHLFGHPARMKEILKIAKKHKLVVIEDCSQAHGASYHGKKVGTIGDIGVFSMNATKQIAIGEGGMLITNNRRFAERAQLVRNHGEVWGGLKKKEDMIGILGWGYLMNEMSAAVGLAQMKTIDRVFKKREFIARKLSDALSAFPFLTPPVTERHCSHAYYVYTLRYDENKTGVPLQRFVEAVKAEGIPIGAGYVEPLYWNPVYQWKVFYGKGEYPYSHHPRKIEYRRGDCPVVERLHLHEAINTMWTHPSVGKREIDGIVRTIGKIARNFDALKKGAPHLT